jgi:hypothetical protein
VPVEEDIIDEEEQQGDEEAEFPDDEDEMAGFIVDEEEMDENGQFVKCVYCCVGNFIICSNLLHVFGSLQEYLVLCLLQAVVYILPSYVERRLKGRCHDKLQVFHHLLCRRPTIYLVMLRIC